jgi:Ca-activated chloride channel homolog
MRILTLLILLANATLHGQVRVTPASIQFGTFTRETDAVVDILVENTSGKKDFLLRHTFSHEYDVKISSKTLEPGGQIVIRILFNPRTKGPFEDRIELYFANSQTPVILPVSADVQYVNPNGNLPCPDFGQREAECCVSNLFLVEVVDDETGEAISKATVKIEENGYLHLRLQTNETGRVSQEARIGFFEIKAEKQGYFPASLHSYINKRNNKFTLRLKRDENFNPKTDALYIPPADSVVAEEKPQENELLPESLYSPNNIVFLLDISGSMKVGDKMDLMRKALSELTGTLRPVDQITLVSYADQAKVILPTHSGADKSEIIDAVANLRADGKTSGTKGFKRSFDILRKTFKENGNNQLIVITDGAFRPEDQEGIEKLVKRAAQRRMRTTTVAIKGSNYALETLAALSQAGNGSFLQLNSMDEAEEALIEELRKQSRK